MSLWGRVFAASYDRFFLSPSEEAGLTDLRRGLLAGARGRVLELGAGTGLNVALYPREGIDRLVLTEPEAPMARRLAERVAADGRPGVELVAAGGEALPFADGAFDTVVSTLVLCTVSDVGRTLAEVRRVLAPGGRLLFLEHVRHEDADRARRQARLTPLWRHVACGCHLDRDTPALLAGAGFTVAELERSHFPKGPSFVQPLKLGTAVPA